MPLEGFGVWIAKAIGGQIIRDRFTRRGLQAQLRSLQKALIDSQNAREELAASTAMAERLFVEREQLQAEVIRLRIENVDLRQRLRASGADG